MKKVLNDRKTFVCVQVVSKHTIRQNRFQRISEVLGQKSFWFEFTSKPTTTTATTTTTSAVFSLLSICNIDMAIN